MGLRNSGNTPVSSTAPTDHSSGDFESAFSDLLGGGQENPEAEEVEGLEGEGHEEAKEDQAPQLVKESTEQDPIDKIEEAAKAAREKWKLQKELKEAKAELEKLKSEGKKGSVLDTDNPLREITKLKGWSKDDIVQKALEAMEDDGMTPEQAEKKVESMSQEELIAKVKAELKAEQEAEREQNEKAKITHERIEKFKEKIKEFTGQNAEKYPLIDGMGGVGHVYKMIEDDYIKNEEEYGVEYAQKNIMTIEKAAKAINDKLASSVKDALKSDHVRKYILSIIKEDGGRSTKDNQLEDFFQLEDAEPETLTNSVHRRSTDPKDSRELTEEERFEQAFAYLK